MSKPKQVSKGTKRKGIVKQQLAKNAVKKHQIKASTKHRNAKLREDLDQTALLIMHNTSRGAHQRPPMSQPTPHPDTAAIELSSVFAGL